MTEGGRRVFETHSSSGTQARPRALDSIEEPWIILEAIVEPVVLCLETDEHAGRLAVPRDDDLRLPRAAIVGSCRLH